MGGFYGSVQVRTENRAAVLRAAETAATRAGIRCLIGPSLNGWVGVYPEGAGQDHLIGQTIARAFGGDVLQLAVHDDAVLAYWLWHEGELGDAYWSRPGFFNEDDRAEQLQMTGDPQAFGDLLEGREKTMLDLVSRRRIDITFESARLQEFASLLGIHNGVTSYEYLKAGERAGIEQWELFSEVPAEAVAAEQAALRAKRQQIALRKEQLRDNGLLLSDVVEQRLLPRACAANGGMLVAWEGFGRDEARIEFYRAPWGEAEPGEIETGGVVNSLAADPAGRRVAMALGNRVVVWDADDWQPVLELVESDWATLAAISSDGKLLAYASRNGVFVHEIETGKRLTALSAHEATTLAFHPSGQWLMMGSSAIWIARIADTEPWRELYPGGQAPLRAELSEAVKKEMSRVDLDAMEHKWRTAIEASVQKMAAAGQKSEATATLVEKMHQQMDKQLELMRANLAKLKAGQLPAPREGIENVLCAGFTRDGCRLWCGTDRGLHVYDWQAVAASPPNCAMPPPAISHAPLSINAGGQIPAMIYAATESARRGALFFGGYAGQLCELSLQTGQVRELASPPDGGAIVGLVQSADGAAIGVCSRPALGPNGATDDERAVWEIWSCDGLLK
ncbi:MAG TPA: hypothetical protein VFE47_07745 [Tepidisphaeraceae bacterium]|jgi:hypothetical protein|nr:hypothetical protein [Tepidisphaeraceae bacterium]